MDDFFYIAATVVSSLSLLLSIMAFMSASAAQDKLDRFIHAHNERERVLRKIKEAEGQY